MQDIEKKAERIVKILKFVAHPKRFMLLCRLCEGPKTVSELEAYCTIGQSQLSQFLGKMKDEGILNSEKNGQYVSYWIADPRINKMIEQMSEIFCKD